MCVEPASVACHTCRTLHVTSSAVTRVCCAGGAASDAIQQQFSLSKEQAEGVLNMSLRRLTSLEANRLLDEAQQLHERYSTAHSLSFI